MHAMRISYARYAGYHVQSFIRRLCWVRCKVYAAFSNIRGGILSLPFLCWIARTAHDRAKQPPLPLRCSISRKAGRWTLNRHERKSAPSAAVALYSAADQAYRRPRSLWCMQLAFSLRHYYSEVHSLVGLVSLYCDTQLQKEVVAGR